MNGCRVCPFLWQKNICENNFLAICFNLFPYICASLFVLKLTTYQISDESGELPFVISDIMGLEAKQMTGLQADDIVKTILGHVKEDYTVINHFIHFYR